MDAYVSDCKFLRNASPFIALQTRRGHHSFVRQRLLVIGIMVTLAGCTAAGKHDIDVTCSEGNLNSVTFEGQDVEKMFCTDEGGFFDIKCDRRTVQTINDILLCSTHDGKSVRIRRMNQ